MRLLEIKNKINLTQNIYGLTQALELISAVRMKRLVKLAVNSRPLVQKVIAILKRLSQYQKISKIKSIYFQSKRIKKILVLVLASDRGFCGFYNRNILKLAEKEIKELEKEGKVEIIAIGKKAVNFFKKAGYQLKEEILDQKEYQKFEKVRDLTERLFQDYQKNEYQKIYFYCTHYFTPFYQLPRKIQVLPLEEKNLDEMLKKIAGITLIEKSPDYIFEPSAKEILDKLVSELMEFEIYHAILEALASEEASRMMAMKRAMDNAKEIVKDLILKYHKARQFQITAEVCEITTAKEATK
ncbi:MAG: ATP synthase F1 subunit gamma [Patescibacteria group bacterium]|nr:ATP synthase F1 subunit gamma [Patescibacteria group bacterium]